MNTLLKLGFTYRVQTLDRRGRVADEEVVHNLVPAEGLEFLISALFKGTGFPGTWYIAPFVGNYTPRSFDTAATFPTLATEGTGYTEGTRQAFVPGTVMNGSVDNGASPAVFTFSDEATVYGGFMTQAPAKGATSGVLLSAVRFSSPKQLEADGVLRVFAGFDFISE